MPLSLLVQLRDLFLPLRGRRQTEILVTITRMRPGTGAEMFSEDSCFIPRGACPLQQFLFLEAGQCSLIYLGMILDGREPGRRAFPT